MGGVWHMLNDNVPYHELGGDYFTQQDPERAARRAVSRLNELGYRVTLDPIGRRLRGPNKGVGRVCR